MQLLTRSVALLAGAVVAVLVTVPASLAPAATAESGSVEGPTASISKASSRIAAKTGAYEDNDYDYYAVGTLFRDGKKYPGKRVVLQARVEGDWKRVDVAHTSVYGTVRWYFKPSSLRWRLKYPGDKRTYRDYSGTFLFGSGRIAGGDRAADPTDLVTQAR